jgi:hypothetical protein
MYLDADFATATRVVVALFHEIMEGLIHDEMRINDYKSELQNDPAPPILPVYKVTAEINKPRTRPRRRVPDKARSAAAAAATAAKPSRKRP